MAKSGNNITLVTSLVPNKRAEIQEMAVASWLSAGFTVISVNGDEELHLVQSDYPDVQFVSARRTGKIIANRPVIYINELLDALKENGNSCCGIINSDIILADTENLQPRLMAAAEEAILAISRVDLTRLDSSTGILDPIGFDCFVFNSEQLDTWPESRFCLGMPHWDHWFPLVPISAGKKLCRLESNAFRHLTHETDRDDSFFIFTDELVTTGLALMTSSGALSLPSDLDAGTLNRNYTILKAAALEASSIEMSDDERFSRYEALAQFQDEFAKTALRCIWAHSATLRLD